MSHTKPNTTMRIIKFLLQKPVIFRSKVVPLSLIWIEPEPTEGPLSLMPQARFCLSALHHTHIQQNQHFFFFFLNKAGFDFNK